MARARAASASKVDSGVRARARLNHEKAMPAQVMRTLNLGQLLSILGNFRRWQCPGLFCRLWLLLSRT
jgi:hypothetical protein